MEESLHSNQKLSQTLTDSEHKLQNMTKNIENFLNQLNLNLISQYSSIVKAMETINQGIDGLNTVQGFMISEINTMSGILYFLLQILILMIITSFGCFRRYRFQAIAFFVANILVEVLVPNSILLFVGIKVIRILFVLLHVFSLIKAFLQRENHFAEIKNYMDGRLDTQRIKRIFKEIMN